MTTKEEIINKISELASVQAWNHNIVLPYNIETRPGEHKSHGKNLIKLKRIEGLLNEIDLKGKRVLDMGCNEGFFSLKLAEMGADVLGIDIDAERIKKARFVKETLCVSNVRFECLDIYSEEFKQLQNFDFILCLGFLHRIPDPFTAIKRLSDKTNVILFEWKSLKHGPHHQPIAYFCEDEFNRSDFYGTQYWLLSYACLEAMLKKIGIKNFYRLDDPSQKRSILVAGRHNSPLFEKPQDIKSGSKIYILLRHTKHFLNTVKAIFTGQLNA